MKKVISLLFCLACSCAYLHAEGPWLIGMNQIDDFLANVEQGSSETDTIPVFGKNQGGNLDTDVGAGNDLLYNIDHVGIEKGFYRLTPEKIQYESDVFGSEGPFGSHHGIKTIEIVNKGYRQKEGTMISFVQLYRPIEVINWPDCGMDTPEKNKKEYFNRYLLQWLEKIDLSGNDLHFVEINGRGTMPLTEISLKGNPNLIQLDIRNCLSLQTVDITECNLLLGTVADIVEMADGATVLYSKQGEMSMPYDDVDLTDIVVANGEDGIVISWQQAPQSSNGSVYAFSEAEVGQTVTASITNTYFPEISITYDIKLLPAGSSDISAANVNPVTVYMQNNSIYIKDKASDAQVLVYDLFGNLLLESYRSVLNASALNNGIYLVKVNDQVTKILKR